MQRSRFPGEQLSPAASRRIDPSRSLCFNGNMIKAKIKAVLFDKDGTLIDFHQSWYPVFEGFCNELGKIASLDEPGLRRMMHGLGADESGFRADSVFALGSYPDIMAAVQEQIPGITMEDLQESFTKTIETMDIQAVPIGDAARTLQRMKNRGLRLGVATADRKSNALRSLESAGLAEHFDFIGADDSVPRGKPAPDLMELFCREQDLHPSQVAIVGDSMRDMEFARNSRAGAAIFVRSSYPDPKAEAMADYIYPDINALPDEL